jgi:tRNA threonylcarbamoyladenosine biosynthesis protein TsaE
MKKSKFHFKSESDFCLWVEKLSKELRPREVILLKGDLGAGKTRFVTTLIETLGGKSQGSPTFSVYNTYQFSSTNLDHVDLYRLKDSQDLESTGFWELFEKTNGLIAIEWAQRFEGVDWIPRGWSYSIVQIDFENDLKKEKSNPSEKLAAKKVAKSKSMPMERKIDSDQLGTQGNSQARVVTLTRSKI